MAGRTTVPVAGCSLVVIHTSEFSGIGGRLRSMSVVVLSLLPFIEVVILTAEILQVSPVWYKLCCENRDVSSQSVYCFEHIEGAASDSLKAVRLCKVGKELRSELWSVIACYYLWDPESGECRFQRCYNGRRGSASELLDFRVS